MTQQTEPTAMQYSKHLEFLRDKVASFEDKVSKLPDRGYSAKANQDARIYYGGVIKQYRIEIDKLFWTMAQECATEYQNKYGEI